MKKEQIERKSLLAPQKEKRKTNPQLIAETF
jgi:hypothetical protein